MAFTLEKVNDGLHDRKTEYLKALAKSNYTSTIADQDKTTGHNVKWDHLILWRKAKQAKHEIFHGIKKATVVEKSL